MCVFVDKRNTYFKSDLSLFFIPALPLSVNENAGKFKSVGKSALISLFVYFSFLAFPDPCQKIAICIRKLQVTIIINRNNKSVQIFFIR